MTSKQSKQPSKKKAPVKKASTKKKPAAKTAKDKPRTEVQEKLEQAKLR
jgi:hypothetical protein